MSEFVTIEVHKEFAQRVDDENKRQNIRLDALERGLQEIGKITINVERLATQMETLTKEISKQGERLEGIEQKPAKRWDVVITGAISAIVGALMAAMMTGLIK